MVLERPSPCMDMYDFWLHYDGLFSERMARHFMQQVIDSTAVCCSRGVLHRDIKMPNLLVNIETLEVKLIDFGCGDLLKRTLYKTYSGMYYFSNMQFETYTLVNELTTNSFLQEQQGTALLNILRGASTMGNRQRCGHLECSCSAWSPAFSPRAAISVWWTLISGPSEASPMVRSFTFVIRQNGFIKEVLVDNPGIFLILQLRKCKVKGNNQTSLYCSAQNAAVLSEDAWRATRRRGFIWRRCSSMTGLRYCIKDKLKLY